MECLYSLFETQRASVKNVLNAERVPLLNTFSFLVYVGFKIRYNFIIKIILISLQYSN